ncbi:MAG TPA: SpoIIIAH-like family protein [Clostridia bacterium]|nr:SpoIIIAH-like family protein [Clostridia bacterium]
MMVFKRKQVVVLALVLMLVVAGYIQWTYKNSSSNVSKDTGNQGEAIYVSGDNKTQDKTKDKKASKFANDYFAQAKLDRDMSRSKSKDTFKSITEDQNATKEEKAEAYDEMMRLSKNAEKEMRMETLIKREGYSDVLVLLGDDGSVDIEFKSPTMTSQQVAKITDIVIRQADLHIRPEDMHVKNIF